MDKRALNVRGAALEIARLSGRPCLVAEFRGWSGPLEDILMAAPYLELDRDDRAIIDGVVFVLCTDAEEGRRFVSQTTYGKPTDTNMYAGACKVWAVCAMPDGTHVTNAPRWPAV